MYSRTSQPDRNGFCLSMQSRLSMPNKSPLKIIQTIRTPAQSSKRPKRTILRTNSSIREIMDENWLVEFGWAKSRFMRPTLHTSSLLSILSLDILPVARVSHAEDARNRLFTTLRIEPLIPLPNSTTDLNSKIRHRRSKAGFRVGLMLKCRGTSAMAQKLTQEEFSPMFPKWKKPKMAQNIEKRTQLDVQVVALATFNAADCSPGHNHIRYLRRNLSIGGSWCKARQVCLDEFLQSMSTTALVVLLHSVMKTGLFGQLCVGKAIQDPAIFENVVCIRGSEVTSPCITCIRAAAMIAGLALEQAQASTVAFVSSTEEKKVRRHRKLASPSAAGLADAIEPGQVAIVGLICGFSSSFSYFMASSMSAGCFVALRKYIQSNVHAFLLRLSIYRSQSFAFPTDKVVSASTFVNNDTCQMMAEIVRITKPRPALKTVPPAVAESRESLGSALSNLLQCVARTAGRYTLPTPGFKAELNSLALGLVVCIRLRRTSLRLISTDEARYRVVGNVVQFEFILVFVDGVATGGFGEWDGYTLGVSEGEDGKVHPYLPQIGSFQKAVDSIRLTRHRITALNWKQQLNLTPSSIHPLFAQGHSIPRYPLNLIWIKVTRMTGYRGIEDAEMYTYPGGS
ncbi:hypothetical protein CCUS01_13834 [Colletotrichum cuscutae]|uniref:Uncharacterized protein n=1 Tax=Colletotrichum cuscutae TaxID=1209917 RepID=A0AAI9YAL9_9PEZI|nr:hypothetical protein CCUS01_13834 [Colletotrichum cuscutae]